MTFRDHFSARSASYARHRPHYPDELFAWLAAQAPARGSAVDVATGNGQAAIALARHFTRVTAFDASASQLAAAVPAPNIVYKVAPAEALPLPDASADLVTVAQALHWLDPDRTYAEAQRVLVPGGLFAAWTYDLLVIDPAVDRLTGHLYRDLLGHWWPPERRHVETGYTDLPFPFRRLEAPRFTMVARWDCDRMVGYLRTWSAWKAATDAGEPDPVMAIEPALRKAFGDGVRTVRWPLSVLAGRPGN